MLTRRAMGVQWDSGMSGLDTFAQFQFTPYTPIPLQ